ncbi:MAG TPA: UvrB/UvrC motif-containing protein [Verrucomicrobiae bacterium]|nr:UvrB/UvrC motif-containing protein [Verrucomicrobiae bacterium]
MYCEQCNKHPATVHVTKIINGQKFEAHLCQECAQKDQDMGIGLQSSLAIPNFLAALFNLSPQVEQVLPAVQTTCEKCGLSLEQVLKIGRLGCDNCYSHFEDKLEPLLRRVHGSGQHIGKVPLRRGDSIRQRKEIDKLRTFMQQLITREEFEQAAQVRDQIRSLEQGLGG